MRNDNVICSTIWTRLQLLSPRFFIFFANRIRNYFGKWHSMLIKNARAGWRWLWRQGFLYIYLLLWFSLDAQSSRAAVQERQMKPGRKRTVQSLCFWYKVTPVANRSLEGRTKSVALLQNKLAQSDTFPCTLCRTEWCNLLMQRKTNFWANKSRPSLCSQDNLLPFLSTISGASFILKSDTDILTLLLLRWVCRQPILSLHFLRIEFSCLSCATSIDSINKEWIEGLPDSFWEFGFWQLHEHHDKWNCHQPRLQKVVKIPGALRSRKSHNRISFHAIYLNSFGLGTQELESSTSPASHPRRAACFGITTCR